MGIELVVEVHCERCGTSYSFDESRLGEDGARVRCARCGHVFLVPKAAGAAAPGRTSSGDSVRREWRVRRRDGSVSLLRELTTLQRWIVEGTLGREDEIGLDGETWRVLGTIPDLGPFFAAADARAQVALLEKELAQLKARAEAQPEPAVSPAPSVYPAEPARPRPRTLSTVPPVQPVSPPLNRTLSGQTRTSPYAEAPGPSEPAFTRTAAGLGVPPTDDWEPPKLSRGLGAWVVVVLLSLVLAALGTAAYFYVWLPEKERAREEQMRNSQLEHEQGERDARLKAAEQRAKEELLQSLAAAQARDAGPPAALDAGPAPRGALEPPPPPAGPPPAEARVPAPTLATGPNKPPLPAKAEPDADGPSGATAAAPAVLRASPQSFEDWMAEADRRRTHERASSALAAYDKALALKPQRSDAHAGRGLALLDLGRRPEALVEFQRALELDPRDGVAVLGMAETYRSLGRSEEARRAYQRYLEGWPGGPEASAARAALESLKE